MGRQIEWFIDYYKKNGAETKHDYMTVGDPRA